MRYSLALLILLSVFSTIAEAHRSGCHRWHSCPSDSGSYICGDTGRCSGCPDNQYCENSTPRIRKPIPSQPSYRETTESITIVEPQRNSFQPSLKEETPPPKEPATKSKKHSEADYRDHACMQLKGRTEYVLDDGSRVDCLTETHAIEVDFAGKWAEAIGQSLYYGVKTGKQPGIILIIPKEKDMRHMEKIKEVVRENGLNIKLWSIRPEDLLANN